MKRRPWLIQDLASIPDVYADLFRFLMTGRTGIAVNEWLGSRMTPRVCICHQFPCIVLTRHIDDRQMGLYDG